MSTLTYQYPTMRIIAIMPIACVITLLLLYLMHRLVYVEEVEIVEETPVQYTAVVMEKKKIETRKEEPLKKPVDPESQPVAIIQQAVDIDPVTSVDIEPGYRVDRQAEIKSQVLGGGQLMPYLRVQPAYPQRALTRGAEGYVDMVFDVTAYGATENVRVLHAEPEGVFDRAAIKAVKRWKYKPNYSDGVAMRTDNLRERIRFNIAK